MGTADQHAIAKHIWPVGFDSTTKDLATAILFTHLPMVVFTIEDWTELAPLVVWFLLATRPAEDVALFDNRQIAAIHGIVFFTELIAGAAKPRVMYLFNL
jgi:hypothetical protein